MVTPTVRPPPKLAAALAVGTFAGSLFGLVRSFAVNASRPEAAVPARCRFTSNGY